MVSGLSVFTGETCYPNYLATAWFCWDEMHWKPAAGSGQLQLFGQERPRYVLELRRSTGRAQFQTWGISELHIAGGSLSKHRLYCNYLIGLSLDLCFASDWRATTSHLASEIHLHRARLRTCETISMI